VVLLVFRKTVQFKAKRGSEELNQRIELDYKFLLAPDHISEMYLPWKLKIKVCCPGIETTIIKPGEFSISYGICLHHSHTNHLYRLSVYIRDRYVRAGFRNLYCPVKDIGI
jgi:hypothetical protein